MKNIKIEEKKILDSLNNYLGKGKEKSGLDKCSKEDWTYILKNNPDLSDDFLDKIILEFNFNVSFVLISLTQNMTYDFMEKYKDDLHWNIILKRIQLSEDLLEKFKDYLDFNTICHFQTVSESFLERNKGKINWIDFIDNDKSNNVYDIKKELDISIDRDIYGIRNIPDDFILEKIKEYILIQDKKWQDEKLKEAKRVNARMKEKLKPISIEVLSQIEKRKEDDFFGINRKTDTSKFKSSDWKIVSRNKNLPLWFIKKYINNVFWQNICKYNKNLTIDFMDEHSDKLHWDNVSRYQKLNYLFIRKYKDRVNWKLISLFQEIDENLVFEFLDKIDYNMLSLNCKANISEEFKEEHKDRNFWWKKNNLEIRNETLLKTEFPQYFPPEK